MISEKVTEQDLINEVGTKSAADVLGLIELIMIMPNES